MVLSLSELILKETTYWPTDNNSALYTKSALAQLYEDAEGVTIVKVLLLIEYDALVKPALELLFQVSQVDKLTSWLTASLLTDETLVIKHIMGC